MNNRYQKIAGSLIGGAIGDALGFQIEFKRNIKEREITKFHGIGNISDDTQMTLFTANALLWRNTQLHLKGIEIPTIQAIYYGYLDWLETQMNYKQNIHSISWIKNIPELHDRRAPGNTCICALSSGKMGTIDTPINNSKGCGTVMRIAPIGLYADTSEQAAILAAEASAITHGHPLGIIPSFVMASMIHILLNENESINNALNKAIEELKKYHQFNKEDVEILLNLINKAVTLSKENKSDLEAIKEIGEGWVAEEAFAIALYACLKYQNSFEDAVICAVNHDGDSDSTGAIAGNIIGTSLGIKSIPDDYINHLELKDIILEIAHDLATDITTITDEKWINKYIHCQYHKN